MKTLLNIFFKIIATVCNAFMTYTTILVLLNKMTLTDSKTAILYAGWLILVMVYYTINFIFM